ncbi:hypothetical protein [Photorhabdus akhurstii]|uniref:hypothetical protein n=1 Tax=Photorhabdus akhurstii TaxID=171438 RepID=UPI003704B2B8
MLVSRRESNVVYTNRWSALSRKNAGYDGGGGGDDMLEARVARLESDVEHIKKSIDEVKTDVREMRKDARSDFRLLFGAIIAVALGLAGLMAKGFHWI